MELKEESVILVSQEEIEAWDLLGEVLQQFLALDYCPNIITLSRKRALVELMSKYETNEFRGFSVVFQGKIVSVLPWSPHFGIKASSWVFLTTRWGFFGIPYHMITYKVMDSLCSCFGMVVASNKWDLLKV